MNEDLRARHHRLACNHKIRFREWICSGIFLSFIVFSIINEWRYFQSKTNKVLKLTCPQQNITINLRGAVKKPGCYSIATGEVLKDVLDQAEVLQNAAKDNLYMKKRIVENQTLVIPEKNRDNKRRKK